MGASALGARLGSFTLEMKTKDVTSATKEPVSLFSPRGLNRPRTWCLTSIVGEGGGDKGAGESVQPERAEQTKDLVPDLNSGRDYKAFHIGWGIQCPRNPMSRNPKSRNPMS